MDRQELPFLSATRLGELIRSREVSPVDAVESYLERIERLDPKLKAYITVCGDRALEDAHRAQEEISAGRYLGPMHGIPVGIKDLIDTKDVRTTSGSLVMEEFVPDEDATVVSRLKQAGAIILGKTNLTEFAMGNPTQYRYGTPRNPWDLDRIPGSSSSGSANATAAFLCASSLGTDTGGSVRGPAAFCGLAGMRPTWGRVSLHGILPQSWSMDAPGPLSRTVEDAAITLQAIAGYDTRDPYTWKTPVPDYTRGLNGDIKGLKVGVIKERVYSDIVEPDVREAVVAAIDKLSELGAQVEEVSMPLTRHSWAISTAIAMAEAAAAHRERIEQIDRFSEVMQLRLRLGSILPAQAYYKAQRLRAVLRQQILDALDGVDVLATCTYAVAAMPIPKETPGTDTTKEREKQLLYNYRSFAAPFNLAGVPAMSVPCGFTSEGLPVGLQIAGRPMDEATVFKVGYAYQESTPWHTRRPPI